MNLNLRYYNDSVLRKKTNRILKFNNETINLAMDMQKVMMKHKGIGIAAPQIGESKKAFAINLRVFNKSDYMIDGIRFKKRSFSLFAINPKIEFASNHYSIHPEGCLSMPNIIVLIKRSLFVYLKYQDTYGKGHRISCKGYLACCIQHEVDHLNGILHIDRARQKIEVDELRS